MRARYSFCSAYNVFSGERPQDSQLESLKLEKLARKVLFNRGCHFFAREELSAESRQLSSASNDEESLPKVTLSIAYRKKRVLIDS